MARGSRPADEGAVMPASCVPAARLARPGEAAACRRSSIGGSVQGKAHSGVAQLAGRDERRARHLHRVQPALDVADPEIEEAAEDWELRREVHVLLQEALQDARMV